MEDEPVREHEVYLAKLAEQAERYDDMAMHMRKASLLGSELDGKERNMLAVGYKQAVGMRRTAWRIVCNRELEEEAKGNDDNLACARQLRKKIEAELRSLCTTYLALLGEHLIPQATTAEAKVAFYKSQGDMYRYIAEISDDVDKTRAITSGRDAYEEGTRIAEASLPVTSAVRLGLALNHAVFHYEAKKSPTEAVRIARKAFEDAVREIDNLGDDSAKEAALSMQLLRDNLALWTSDDAR